MAVMDFGIAFANTLQFTERDGLETLARSAEAAGFDSVWTVEHVIYGSLVVSVGHAALVSTARPGSGGQ